jgi:hypothetical protein
MLSDLVPRIRKASFDDVAEDFLARYCPYVLYKPMAVPIERIAVNCLNLTIINEWLTEDSSVLGQMCFTGGLAEIYDPFNDEYREIEVKAGTMIIDPDTVGWGSIGRKRNTIAHECFHWTKHRPYHIAARAIESKAAVAFRCPTEGKKEYFKKEWSDEDWMEWQANGIAPRILMPRETVGITFERLMAESRYNNLVAAGCMNTTMWIVEKLADFYQVSKQSAEIRLKELGYIS